MSLVERSVRNVRRAVSLIGKKPLADRARIQDTNLRRVDSEDWNPTRATLNALEAAAKEVIREQDARHPEQGGANPPVTP